jgi:F-type H+-transporting ATPase subunit b
MSVSRSVTAAMMALVLVACRAPLAQAAHEDQPAAEAGAAAHAGGEQAEADPLSFDPDLAVWTIFVFVVLLLVLWRFAWGPISKGLELREQTIAEHIAAVERAHEDAKRLLAEHERKLAGAADEVRALMEEARRNAEHAKQEILTEAKASADAERKRALHDIEAATDQALKSLAERSADLAVELAGKIVQSKLSASDHTRLIQEAVARFPQSHASHN